MVSAALIAESQKLLKPEQYFTAPSGKKYKWTGQNPPTQADFDAIHQFEQSRLKEEQVNRAKEDAGQKLLASQRAANAKADAKLKVPLMMAARIGIAKAGGAGLGTPQAEDQPTRPQTQPIDVRPNGQPVGTGFDFSLQGIGDSLRRIGEAIPAATEEGIIAGSQGVSRLVGQEPASTDFIKNAGPTRLAKGIVQAGQYVNPVTGPVLGAAGLGQIATGLATDPQGTVKGIAEGFNFFDPKIDPIERGTRAINVLATIYGGYHAAQGIAKGVRILDVSKQLGVSKTEALKIVNWAEEASQPGPARTGIKVPGRDDAKGTAANIALGNYEQPVQGAAPGPQTRIGTDGLPVKTPLKPAEPINIPGKQGPQPATFGNAEGAPVAGRREPMKALPAPEPAPAVANGVQLEAATQAERDALKSRYGNATVPPNQLTQNAFVAENWRTRTQNQINVIKRSTVGEWSRMLKEQGQDAGIGAATKARVNAINDLTQSLQTGDIHPQIESALRQQWQEANPVSVEPVVKPTRQPKTKTQVKTNEETNQVRQASDPALAGGSTGPESVGGGNRTQEAGQSGIPAASGSWPKESKLATPKEPLTLEQLGVKSALNPSEPVATTPKVRASSIPKGTSNEKTNLKENDPLRNVQDGQGTVQGEQPQGQGNGQKANAVVPEKEEVNTTGLRMSQRAKESEAGLTSEPLTIGGKPLTELQKQGAKMVEDGKDPYKLVEKLASKGRPATDVEYGAIAEGRRRLISEVAQAKKELDAAIKSKASNVEDLRSDYLEAREKTAAFDGHLDKVKSASGLSLNALKIGTEINEANFAEVIAEAQRRTPNVPGHIERKLEQLTARISELESKSGQTILDAAKAEAERTPKPPKNTQAATVRRTAIRDERAALQQRLARQFSQTNLNIDPSALVTIGKIGMTYVKEGLVTFEEVAAKLREHVKDYGVTLTDDDVKDALRSALPQGRKLTELELKNRRANDIARNQVRAILGDLKPVSGVKRVENALRELQLSNPESRIMDFAANAANAAAYVAESPVRYIVTRGKEKPLGYQALREILRGSRERWGHEAKQTMAGADPDAIAKYGKAPGLVSRMAGLSDVPFKDFYQNVVYRDTATKLYPKDLQTQRAVMDQLRGVSDGGPLPEGAVADIQAEAHEFALRKTFNADNWLATGVQGGVASVRRAAYNGMIKNGASEKIAANAADAIGLIPNVLFRYSKVIGNVAHDSVTRMGFGVAEATAGRIAAGMRVEREGLRIRLKNVGLTDAQSRVLSDKMARGLAGPALLGIGGALAAKKLFYPDVVKTKSGYFFDYGELEQLGGWVKPLMVGATIQTIQSMDLSDSEKQKLIAKEMANIAFNQPLTSGFKKASQLTDVSTLPKAFGSVVATSLVPGIVSGAARIHDKATTGTGYRKTKTIEDEFKARIPGLRQQLPSGEESRTPGKPGLRF